MVLLILSYAACYPIYRLLILSCARAIGSIVPAPTVRWWQPGGPYLVPRSLLLPQTSPLGQIGGPFLNSIPSLPANWTGAGRSYAYHILPAASF